jgi:adenylate kinase
MALVFMGGIHGVGKSSVCALLAASTGVEVISASAVIRKELTSGVTDIDKAVADVGGNQSLLVRGLQKVVSGRNSTHLLDGHFALRTTTGSIEKIDACVFETIGVRHIMCLYDDPVAITRRLQDRDGFLGNVTQVAELQQAEVEHAVRVSMYLQVPCHLVPTDNTTSLTAIVQQARSLSARERC